MKSGKLCKFQSLFDLEQDIDKITKSKSHKIRAGKKCVPAMETKNGFRDSE